MIAPSDIARARERHKLSGMVTRDGIALKRFGGEWSGKCPFHDDGSPSLRVYDDDNHYHCFGCGAHGDAIAWRMARNHESFAEAVEALLGEKPEAAAAPARDPSPAELPRSDHGDLARALRASSRAIARTPGVTYFRARGITIPLPDALRWNDKIGAVVAAIVEGDGVVAVHRIFPDPQRPGRAREKKLLGPPGGGAVRLAPADVRLGISEGIETALAVMQAMPGLPCWAAISAGGLAKVDLPELVVLPLILADRDPVSWKPGPVYGRRPGEYWAQRAAARFRAQGRKPSIAVPPGDRADFNDLLLEAV